MQDTQLLSTIKNVQNTLTGDENVKGGVSHEIKTNKRNDVSAFETFFNFS